MAIKPTAEAAFDRLRTAMARVESAAARLRESRGDAGSNARLRGLQAEVEAAIVELDRLSAASETQ